MRSNVCRIENGTHDLNAIVAESEKVAVYNGLNKKQTLQMRLLCEEIDGMLPWIVEDFSGDLWIEFENDVCKVNVSLKLAELTVDKKEKLIDIAKNKKNAEAVGIVGKIRSGIEDFLLDDGMLPHFQSLSNPFQLATGYNSGVDYSYVWTLEQYRNSVKQEDQEAAWDELEKSVIASVADDVIVGVKGKQVDIVVVKSFAQGE